MKNTGKIISAFIAGFVVGAILGLILAPNKGSETVKKIGNRSKKLAEDMMAKSKNKLADLKEQIADN